MDTDIPLRESARSVVHESLQLLRLEVRAILRRVVPDKGVLRTGTVVAAACAASGFFAISTFVAAMVLALGEVMPFWAAALVIALVLGGVSAALAMRLRRLIAAWKGRRLRLPRPSARVIH